MIAKYDIKMERNEILAENCIPYKLYYSTNKEICFRIDKQMIYLVPCLSIYDINSNKVIGQRFIGCRKGESITLTQD